METFKYDKKEVLIRLNNLSGDWFELLVIFKLRNLQLIVNEKLLFGHKRKMNYFKIHFFNLIIKNNNHKSNICLI
jgi:hypothetical protein